MGDVSSLDSPGMHPETALGTEMGVWMRFQGDGFPGTLDPCFRYNDS